MQYQIHDEEGDSIIVTPLQPQVAGIGRVHIRFRDNESNRIQDMLLDDRGVNELKAALRRSVRESLVQG